MSRHLKHLAISLILYPAIGLLWLLSRLPYRWQMQLGAALGPVIYRLAPGMRQTCLKNIQLCFPDQSSEQQQQLLQQSFVSIGKSLFETALGWWASKKRLASISFDIEGAEYFNEAMAAKQPLLLISPHFMTLEIIGRLFERIGPLAVMYRPQKLGLIDRIVVQSRKRHYPKMIANHDLRGMVKTLKSGLAVWYTPDTDPGRDRKKLFIPFFGIKAATSIGTPRLAEMSGAKIMTCFFYRKPDGQGYRIELGKPLENFPTENTEADLTRINDLLEQAIRQAPEQYIWQYKRFKTRPEGEPRLYRQTEAPN